ncbi:MAG: ABC transporter permease [Pseudomonadota bacterium]
MILFSPITQKRIKRFKSIKRGYYSLIILVVAIFFSLFAELIMNNRALVVHFADHYYFPVFKYYTASTFGMEGEGEADYRELKRVLKAEDNENYVVMPLIPYGPYESDFAMEGNPPYPPSREHLLGTDDRGRDVLVRLFYGFRIAILFSLILNIAAVTIGTFIGSFMGYFGGRFDIYSQRIIEVWSTVPMLYLVIILASIFRPSFWLLLIILLLFQWITITYYMRTEMYREKSKDYAFSARASGASHMRIVFKHLLPNSLTPLITFFPFFIVAGISMLTSLDFLGYGLPVPTPSWGELMNQALLHLDKLWLSISPFAAIAITLVLITFVGEALREAFDPKEYSKYV